MSDSPTTTEISMEERFYRAATYTAVAMFHFYRNDLTSRERGQSIEDWAEANDAVVKRVVADVQTSISYDLSHSQLGRAIRAYLMHPTSLANIPDTIPLLL